MGCVVVGFCIGHTFCLNCCVWIELLKPSLKYIIVLWNKKMLRIGGNRLYSFGSLLQLSEVCLIKEKNVHSHRSMRASKPRAALWNIPIPWYHFHSHCFFMLIPTSRFIQSFCVYKFFVLIQLNQLLLVTIGCSELEGLHCDSRIRKARKKH